MRGLQTITAAAVGLRRATVLQKGRDAFNCATEPFLFEDGEQVVDVTDNGLLQTIRRRCLPSDEIVEETQWPMTNTGCGTDEIAISPSGHWLVTQRLSGQGQWGYDVFRSRPLSRVAGVSEESGYMLGLPRFAGDESLLIGAAGDEFLGYWWSDPNDAYGTPARGGVVKFGFLFVHRLPDHHVSRHDLCIDLPRGWSPDNPDAPHWFGPSDVTPTTTGVRFTLSWGIPIEIKAPFPSVITLATPHPSGTGLL
jgi:hypothetical protein